MIRPELFRPEREQIAREIVALERQTKTLHFLTIATVGAGTGLLFGFVIGAVLAIIL